MGIHIVDLSCKKGVSSEDVQCSFDFGRYSDRGVLVERGVLVRIKWIGRCAVHC